MNAPVKKQEKPRIKARTERTRVKTEIVGESLTRQSEAAAADINKIVAKAQKTGFLPVVSAQPIDSALPAPDSFHEAMNIVTHAKAQFDALPVAVRNEFDNNPEKFLEAVHKSDKDEDVKQKLQEFGVLKKPDPEAPPTKVEVVNPPEPDTPPAE